MLIVLKLGFGPTGTDRRAVASNQADGARGRLWIAVAILVVLDVMLRRYELGLWLSVLVLVAAIAFLTRGGTRGRVWRVVTVALVLSTVVSELTGWDLLAVRLASLPVAWLFWLVVEPAKKVVGKLSGMGFRKGGRRS